MAPYTPLQPTWSDEPPSLNFKGYCFSDSKPDLDSNLDLLDYLRENYNVVKVRYSCPFIVLGCRKSKLPAEDKMPFTIAGALAIFLPETQFDTFIESCETLRNYERTKFSHDTECWSFVTEEQVLGLAKEFPRCTTISQIGPDIWLQFPEPKSNNQVLGVKVVDAATRQAPWGIIRCDGQVLPKVPSGRTVPKAWHPTTHRSNLYAQSNTEDFPGLSSAIERSKIMSNSTEPVSNKVKLEPEDTVTLNRTTKMLAGMLLEKEHRRAVMFPAVSGLDNLGDKKIYSASGGRLLGQILEPVKKSGLQLARLESVEFQNRFQNCNLAICPNPHFGQQCVMNTPAAGRRFLYRAGKQFDIKKTDPNTTEPPHYSGIKFSPMAAQPDPREHSISFERGIYFTNTPVTIKTLENQEPSFGRLITVCEEEINKTVAPTRTPIQVSGLTSGFTDVSGDNPVSDFRNYIVYGEELQPLLDQGWTVVETD
ncbi:hypothetical protein ACHAQD_010987 [Fusarium lateritium]